MSTKAIGIDFGGTSIKSAIVVDGRIAQRGERIDTREHLAGGTLLEAIFTGIAALRNGHSDVAAVGLGNFLSYSEHAVQAFKQHLIDMPLRPAAYAAEY